MPLRSCRHVELEGGVPLCGAIEGERWGCKLGFTVGGIYTWDPLPSLDGLSRSLFNRGAL